MGRHPRNFDPKGFENNRERQRQRQLAPLRNEDPPAPEDGPTPTTLQPSRSSRVDMEASTSNGTQHATSAPAGVQGSNVTRTGLYTTVGRADDETLTETRVKVVPGSKRPGITQDLAYQLGLFMVEHPENRKRSIAEGPEPTDRLHTDYSTEIQIRHPGSGDPVYRTANVWRPVPYRPLDYGLRLTSNQRVLCESRDEGDQHPAQPVDPAQPVNIGGHYFGTISVREDFYWLFEDREHDDTSNGGTCRLCFDLSMVEAGIYPNYPS